MPKCKNDERVNYTGKEPSPKGLGYCARAEKLGTKKRGRDGNIWIVKKVSNGSRKWVLLNSPLKESIHYKKKLSYNKMYWNKWLEDLNVTQKSIINKLRFEVKEEIEANKIDYFIIPLHKYSEGFYLIDDAWDKMWEKYGDNYLDNDFIIMVVRLDNGKLDITFRNYCLQHNLNKISTRRLVYDIFYKYFKSRLVWNKSVRKSICIRM